VLSVAVELDRCVVAVLEGPEIAGLHRPADPEVRGELDDEESELPCDVGRPVGGAFVHQADIRVGRVPMQVLRDRGQAPRLVVRGDDDHDSHRDGNLPPPTKNAAPASRGGVFLPSP
jgi:hypothetical protein